MYWNCFFLKKKEKKKDFSSYREKSVFIPLGEYEFYGIGDPVL